MAKLVSISRRFRAEFRFDIGPVASGESCKIPLHHFWWDGDPEKKNYMLVTRMIFSENARWLSVKLLSGDDSVLLEGLASNYLDKPRYDLSDDEAVERIRSCFRYQDHTREEYLAVRDSLCQPLPSKSNVEFLREKELFLIARNPTGNVVSGTGQIEGIVYQTEKV